ncbi:MAG: hypothetical protein ACR5LD_11445 [Symbiopectobacterium sp.]
MPPRFTTEDITVLLEELRQFSTNHGQDGITRLAFSWKNEAVHRYLADNLVTQGLTYTGTQWAQYLRVYPIMTARFPPFCKGSHIDSVPSGGGYENTLRVIIGLYALAKFEPSELKRDLELVVFRAKKSSRFGFSCIGSKVLTGISSVVRG